MDEIRKNNADLWASLNPKPVWDKNKPGGNTSDDYGQYRMALDQWWTSYAVEYNKNREKDDYVMINFTYDMTKTLIEKKQGEFIITTTASGALSLIPLPPPSPLTTGPYVGVILTDIYLTNGSIEMLKKWNADGSGVVLLKEGDAPLWMWDVVDLK